MLNNLEYISYSIYFNKYSWNQLIFNAVAPFLKSIEHDKLFENFMFFKNSIRGENVSIVFKSNPSSNALLDQKIKHYFEEYLHKNPSPDNNGISANEWFSNYSNNSIHNNDFTLRRKVIQGHTGGKHLFPAINEHLASSSEIAIDLLQTYQNSTQEEIINRVTK